eukprot:Nk52_evm9s217 gene=Nk52_evmTU9s217
MEEENQKQAQGEEGNQGSSGGYNWWGYVEAIQKQSEAILKDTKKDLKRFGKELKQDMSAVLAETASTINAGLNEDGAEGTNHGNSDPNPYNSQRKVADAEGDFEESGSGETDEGRERRKSSADVNVMAQKLGSGLASMFEKLSSSLAAPEEEEGGGQMGGVKSFSGHDARLREFQSDMATYCSDPSDGVDCVGLIDVDSKTTEISQILNANENIRMLHSKLIPSVVHYKQFWARYFYKLQKFEESELRRARLVERAGQVHTQGEGDDELMGWDEEEEEDGEKRNKEEKVEQIGKKSKGSMSVPGEQTKEVRKMEKNEGNGALQQQETVFSSVEPAQSSSYHDESDASQRQQQQRTARQKSSFSSFSELDGDEISSSDDCHFPSPATVSSVPEQDRAAIQEEAHNNTVNTTTTPDATPAISTLPIAASSTMAKNNTDASTSSVSPLVGSTGAGMKEGGGVGDEEDDDDWEEWE